MARALQLAARGLTTTSPNPRVGCVIVRDGHVVGEGWHERAGAPHAEVHALHAAGEAARGATVYVTLEPCSHHGRTPPCAEALIQAGVARVVVAMSDPNPLVAGGGISMLTLAGIEAEVGLMEAEARALNPGFISRMTRKRPWVRLKTASTLDGKTALANGALAVDHRRGRARRRAAPARTRLRHPHRQRHRAGRQPAHERARLRHRPAAAQGHRRFQPCARRPMRRSCPR